MNINKNKIWYIILLGFLLRIITVFYLGDLNTNYYWEYGEIAKNVIDGKGYSLFYIDNSKIEHLYNKNIQPSKSAYMPPGYVCFLIPYILIESLILRNILLYLTQIIISLSTIYFIYLFTSKIFNEKIGLIASLITAILPEFIYTVLSFSPTVIYHLLICLLFISIIKYKYESGSFWLNGILIAVTIYFRSEFILFFLIFIGYLLFERKYSYSFKIFFMVVILIFPWSVRNYLIFKEIVPLSTSFGLNFYRGNNSYEIGSWGDESIKKRIIASDNKNLETKLNKIYKDEAFSYIENNPQASVEDSFKKLVYFWTYYPNDKRASHPLYLIPSIVLLALFLTGIASTFKWSRFKIFYFFFIYSSIVVMIFFPMVRYQTMMKIGMIPFCAVGMNKLVQLFFYKERE